MHVKLITLALGVFFLLLSGFRPGTLPYTPGGSFSDAVTSHLPAAQFLRQSLLENGTFPLWRETIMGGQPFAADPLNKTAYPLQWLALLLPPTLHLDVMIALHLLIAGAGMWRWARSLGLREGSASLSALGYALAPRVIGHTGAGHLDLLYALAWFPWLMAALEGKADGKFPLRTALEIGLFGGLVLLADVRLSLFAFALVGAYALFSALRWGRKGRLSSAAYSLPLILSLSASLILPLIAWRPYLSRAALTAAESGVFSMDVTQMAFGLILPARGGNIETLSYLGLPVLALAVVGAVTARRWFWAAAAGIAALYAMGSYGFLWTALVQVFPALLWFRVPSRAWFVVALIAPLLAGYGAQWLIDRADNRSRRGVLITLTVTAALVVTGIFLMLFVPAVNGLAVLVGGGGIGLIGLLALTGRLRGNRLALALLLVTFLDLALVGRGWLEWRSQDAWLPPGQVALAERLTELGAYRVYSPTYSLQQQVAEDYHLRLFGGVDPFQLNGVVEAIKQGGGIDDAGYSVVMPPMRGEDLSTANQSAVLNATVLGQWGVTHVVSAYPIDATALVQVDVVDGVYVYANYSAALVPTEGWPDGWPDLPDRATVDSLNSLTTSAALFSGAAFVVLLALLGVTKVRH